MPRLEHYIGRRYGRLTVIEMLTSEKRKSGSTRPYARLRCDCGGIKERASVDNLRSGRIVHCGCESTRHGGYHTKLYGVWHRIIQCCTDKNYVHYHNYGERGIEVCEAWKQFKVFRAWAESSGYIEDTGLSIERVDNDGHYEPDNCVWIPWYAQAKNKRSNVKVELAGERMIATDAAKKLSMPLSSFLYRLRRNTLENCRAVQES